MLDLSGTVATIGVYAASYAILGAAGGYVAGFILPLASVKTVGLSVVAGVTPFSTAQVCAVAGALIGGVVGFSKARKS